MKKLSALLFSFILLSSIAYGQTADYTAPANNASTNFKRLDQNLEYGRINTEKVDFIDIDTSAEIRAIIGDEIGTGFLMFGLAPTMSDDMACTGNQVLRRNAGDTAWECATIAVGAGDALVADPLSQFAATTSAQLRGVLSDEVGTGSAMFGLISTMGDELGCTGLQVVRRNTGDTAFECASPAGGGDALVANPLSQFAATTSAQLLGVISDETGGTLIVGSASPALTGVPTAPTAAALTNTTQLATTAFVTTADNLKANLAGPTFTGVPAAPTAAAATNTTQLATTAFATTADNLKANLASPTFTGTVSGITKSMVGLGSVDNTTDASKPVSTAQQTALNLKADLAGPTFTGNPIAPTPSLGDNDTSIATTAFVRNKTEALCLALSDETTAITTGVAKVTWRMPYAFTLTNIRGNLNTVSSSGSPIIDVNEGGTSVMTTNKVLIDVSELTSVTAVTAVTLTDTSLADDAEMTADIDTAGTGAKGLKICLIGYQT